MTFSEGNTRFCSAVNKTTSSVRTENMASDMRIDRGQDVVKEDPTGESTRRNDFMANDRLTNQLWHTQRAPVQREHVVRHLATIANEKHDMDGKENLTVMPTRPPLGELLTRNFHLNSPFSPTSVKSPWGRTAKSGFNAQAARKRWIRSHLDRIATVCTFDDEIIKRLVVLMRKQNVVADSGRQDPSMSKSE